MKLNLSKVKKSQVLAALYNNSCPQGMGIFVAINEPMTESEAEAILADADTCKFGLDYVHGRPIKVDLRPDVLDTWLYDRDNGGDGAALRALQSAGLDVEEVGA